MEKLVLNDELEFPVPDGFRKLSDDELKKLNFYGKEGLCLSDPKRHIMITLGQQELGGLTNALLSEKDLVENAEKRIRKPFAAFAYKFNEFKTHMIAGKKVPGFAYEYAVQDIKMYGESYIMKKDRNTYYFNFYLRDGLKEEGLKVCEEFLNEVIFK